MRALLAIGLSALALLASADRASSVEWRLRSEVTVRGDAVQLGDVIEGSIDAGLAGTVLRAAPPEGTELRIARREVLRECVRHGMRPLPELRGAFEVRVRRAVTRAPRLRNPEVLEALNEIALPVGALEQRFNLDQDVALVGDLVGIQPPDGTAGTMMICLLQSRSGVSAPQKKFLRVRRELLAPVLVSSQEIEAGARVSASVVHADTLWIAEARIFDRRTPVTDNDGRWTTVRRVRAGSPMLRTDLRATPIVLRSQKVNWLVNRGGVSIEIETVARGNGALGDWILVSSPFGGRPQRVVVVGPGRVASELPNAEDGILDLSQGGAR